MINMQQSPEVREALKIIKCAEFHIPERQCSADQQHQGVHREDGAGGSGEGEDVPGDHGGLPHLLGPPLPRHPGQLELGVEGRQEVDVSRGDQKT